MSPGYTSRSPDPHRYTNRPSEIEGEVVLLKQLIMLFNRLQKLVVLTPFGEALTAVFEDRTTWQSTPAPKMIKMQTPINSAIGSRNISLVEVYQKKDSQAERPRYIPVLAPCIRVSREIIIIIARIFLVLHMGQGRFSRRSLSS